MSYEEIYRRKKNDFYMNRKRQSDARWRANLAACYETLKHVIPMNKRAARRQISKTSILQETGKHVQFLEGIMQTLLQEKGRRLGFDNEERSLWVHEEFESRKTAFAELFTTKLHENSLLRSQQRKKQATNVCKRLVTSSNGAQKPLCSLVSDVSKQRPLMLPEVDSEFEAMEVIQAYCSEKVGNRLQNLSQLRAPLNPEVQNEKEEEVRTITYTLVDKRSQAEFQSSTRTRSKPSSYPLIPPVFSQPEIASTTEFSFLDERGLPEDLLSPSFKLQCLTPKNQLSRRNDPFLCLFPEDEDQITKTPNGEQCFQTSTPSLKQLLSVKDDDLLCTPITPDGRKTAAWTPSLQDLRKQRKSETLLNNSHSRLSADTSSSFSREKCRRSLTGSFMEDATLETANKITILPEEENFSIFNGLVASEKQKRVKQDAYIEHVDSLFTSAMPISDDLDLEGVFSSQRISQENPKASTGSETSRKLYELWSSMSANSKLRVVRAAAHCATTESRIEECLRACGPRLMALARESLSESFSHELSTDEAEIIKLALELEQ